MSREYMVLFVEEPKLETVDINDCKAQVFMRFTEMPSDAFLKSLATQSPGWRVYCLTGASTWHSVEPGDTQ